MSRPKLRKVNTAQRKKERKATEAALKAKTSMLLDIPEECCVCHAAFDKKNKEMAQTWHVVVFDERKTIRLTCPPCWDKIEEETEGTPHED
tara:strand:+ start:381 stop:653 length:273 start_codon:yes stop_codon:yes gene_type:complete